ncbi:helix-turn-helix transcriptional regulator [Paenibacillus harenae]|uniref:helix-turn-helix transcriptional regulator n=1 Tax=Paenibacillus harenae TaxID=306543 RepID=UPI00278F3B08|nr:AraC family transcriptional regulator [Paenibacillus harenae]MDQ0063002.1 AraC-like DNA-binding protein [Paenibacillus harenae]
MSDQVEKKLTIDGSSFSIQRMRRYGFSSMPRPHSHTFYELYYLMEGERVYFINGNVHVAQQGDMVIVVPHDLHSTASSQVEQFERVLIHFTAEFLDEASRELLKLSPFRQSAVVRIPRKEQPEIERLLIQLVGECKEEQAFYDSYARHLLVGLLICLHRIDAVAPIPPQSNHPMHQKVSEITNYIQTNFRDTLTLEKLAQQYFISPAYLSRIFLRLTGFHISEYIRVIRIREAQKLLRTSRQKVHAIAETVGFEHVSHFNKTFKSVTGVSPLHYRKDHRY